MAYITTSKWTYDDTLDEAALIESARDNLTQLKAMGASSGHLVRIGQNEGLVIVIYPDEGAWNRVRETVEHMRRDTSAQKGGVFTEALNGTAVVSV